MPHESTRTGAGPSWTLRVTLGLVVSALLIVGFAVKNDHNSPSAAGTTTQPTTASNVSSTPTTTFHDAATTSTQPPGPLTNLPPPVTNMAAFKPPGAGCRFTTGAPIPGSATGDSTTTVPTISVVGRCTVLEIGDSLGNDLGWGLARELGHDRQVRLVQADKSSSGLLTPWFYNWPQKERVLLAQYKPQLVVITFGANDEQNLKVNGQVLAFGSVPWVNAYTEIVTKTATAATKTGAYVLWVGMPIMQPNSYRQGMVLLNSVFAKVTAAVPGMTFVPTWDLFANSKGQFEDAARVNNVPSLLREPDGIHFSLVGENVIATYVTRTIAEVFHVRLAPEAPMYIDH